jgi:hypothetical protein
MVLVRSIASYCKLNLFNTAEILTAVLRWWLTVLVIRLLAAD